MATIAAGGQRAIAAGTNIDGVMRLVGQTKAPVILFTYVNPILQYGIEKFAMGAKRHGVVGVIIPDVPLEELDPIREVIRKNGLIMPMFVSPTTPDERMRKIAGESEGFTYLVRGSALPVRKMHPTRAACARNLRSCAR